MAKKTRGARPFPADALPDYLRLIRELRLENELTQAELAAAAGIEHAEFRRLERGRGLMTVEQLRDIAAALDCGPWDFFEGP